MASTWTVELSFDGVQFTPTPAPDLQRGSTWLVGVEAIAMPLLDEFPPFNPPIDEGNIFFAVAIQDGGTNPGAFQRAFFRLGDAEIKPPQWVTFFGLPGFSGLDPALITAGGTLSIFKDFDNNRMVFTGPLGTETLTTTDLDPFTSPSYQNTEPLRARGYGQRLIIPAPTVSQPAYDVDDIVRWFSLTGKQNGVTFEQIALSAADPGDWWPINARNFDPVSGITSEDVLPWWLYEQLSTRQEVEAKVLAADFPVYRDFISWKRRRTPIAGSIDLALLRPQNIVLGAWQPMTNMVMLRRTSNDGLSWTDSIVEETTPGLSPTVQVLASDIWVCYYDGSRIVTQKSQDLGATWSAAMPIGIVGTNPRLVISPEGSQFYFYCAGGDLRLQRSFDFGVTLFDLTPIVVAAGVTPQDFGAVLAADRSLVVSYIGGGNWTSVRSQDWGTTWALM